MRRTVIWTLVALAGAAAATALTVEIARPARARKRAFLIPHFRETPGKAAEFAHCTDTEIVLTYVRGLTGVAGRARSATVQLWLYDDATGGPLLTADQQAVANPYEITLSADPAQRRKTIRIDDLITAKGNFDAGVKLGFGVLVVGGQDPDGVNLQGFVVNAHTSPFDLSVFGFEPEPIAAAAQ